jgi:LysM domain
MFVQLVIRRLTVVACGLAAAAALALGTAAPSPGDAPARHHVVRPGESLWTIAERSYPASDPRQAVYRIEQANHLAGALVEVGQRLVLP